MKPGGPVIDLSACYACLDNDHAACKGCGCTDDSHGDEQS